MAFDKKRGLLAALEDFSEDDGSVGPPDDDALLAATVDADTATRESDAEFQEVEDTRDAMEELEEEGERLEGLIDNVEATAPEGGEPELTKNEANFVAAEAADIYRRLGVKRSRMPAIESFASPSSRRLATKIALEDWKEKAKEIGKAIMEYIKQLIQKLISAWQTLMDTSSKLTKLTDELKKKVANYTPPTKGELRLGGAAKAFGFTKADKDLKPVSNILAMQIKATKAIPTMVQAFGALKQKFGGLKQDDFKDGLEPYGIVFKQLFDGLSGIFSGNNIPDQVSKTFGFEEKFDIVPSIGGVFIGGMYVGVGVVDDRLRIKTTTLYQTADFGESISYPQRADLQAVLNDVGSLLQATATAKQEISKIDATAKELTKEIESPKFTDWSDPAIATRFFKYAISGAANITTGMLEIVPRFNISAAAKALNLVTAAVANQEKAEDAKSKQLG
jgi:hypothetical protein